MPPESLLICEASRFSPQLKIYFHYLMLTPTLDKKGGKWFENSYEP
jgi:hypothetical protein